ncbi:MAG: isoprenylcysteine carboxylmethyltransferase family protein [Desulfobacterales bacterium]
MEGKISRWGVGPIFAALSLGYGMVALAISRYFYPVFQIGFLPDGFLYILGIVLIVIGAPFFLISVIAVMHAYNADALVTNGIYRYCRHPLYASWVVFIVPGIVLLMKDWIGLTVPIFMYFILRKLVKKEELFLENVFGSEYREYKKNVRCILPIGWI